MLEKWKSRRAGRRNDIAAYRTLFPLHMPSLSALELKPYAHFHFRDMILTVRRCTRGCLRRSTSLFSVQRAKSIRKIFAAWAVRLGTWTTNTVELPHCKKTRVGTSLVTRGVPGSQVGCGNQVRSTWEPGWFLGNARLIPAAARLHEIMHIVQARCVTVRTVAHARRPGRIAHRPMR